MNSILEAKIFGFSLGDGWISQSFKFNAYRYISGFSGDTESLIVLKKDLIKLYGDIGKARLREEEMISPKYGIVGYTTQFICNTKVTRRLMELGMPTGKKVEVDWLIPDWIMNGSLEIKSAFISGFYAAEGYTPKMQKNDVTLKAPGFCFHKRAKSEKNYWEIVFQFEDILNDLGVKFNFFKTERFTSDFNYVAEFIISNEHKNVMHFFKLLDLSYSVYKKEETNLVIKYYNEKEKVLNNLSKAIEMSKDLQIPVGVIANKFNVKKERIWSWRNRKSLEAKLPYDFIKYTDFKQQQLSLV